MKKGGWFLIGALVVGLVFTGCSDMSGLFDDIFGDVFGTDADSGEAKENYDLYTSWSESQWRDWFNDHPHSNSDARDAVDTFRGENYYWVSNTSWWAFMYTAWVNGDSIPSDGSLSSSWKEGTWQTWFNTHSVSNTSDVNAVHTFYRQNSGWVGFSNSSWWLTMYSPWAGGASFGTNPFVGTWSGGWGWIIFYSDCTVSSNTGNYTSTWRPGIYTRTGTTTARVTIAGNGSLSGMSDSITISGGSFYWGGSSLSREDQ